MMEDKLKKKTNISLKDNEMVKDFYFYKKKEYEVMSDKLKQFEHREFGTL